MSTSPDRLASRGASRRALRQTVGLTVVAVLAYLGIRNLPVDGGSLHYTDFHSGGQSLLEFCEPGGPQFVPVDRVRSPVTLTLESAGPLRAGEPARVVARLTSASGKPVTADDLLVVHTQKFHLLLVDPSLDDYQHLHPVATDEPGAFTFEFHPRNAGSYRLFADFTPRPTGRALYAGATLEVADGLDQTGGLEPPKARGARVVDVGAFRFALTFGAGQVRINETADLHLDVTRVDGGSVQLEDVMGAPAHVVAFDQGRTGFAHLHPLPSEDTAGVPGALQFQMHLTDPGTYRLWAQVKIEGREIFAPFDLTVEP